MYNPIRSDFFHIACVPVLVYMIQAKDLSLLWWVYVLMQHVSSSELSCWAYICKRPPSLLLSWYLYQMSDLYLVYIYRRWVCLLLSLYLCKICQSSIECEDISVFPRLLMLPRSDTEIKSGPAPQPLLDELQPGYCSLGYCLAACSFFPFQIQILEDKIKTMINKSLSFKNY